MALKLIATNALEKTLNKPSYFPNICTGLQISEKKIARLTRTSNGSSEDHTALVNGENPSFIWQTTSSSHGCINHHQQ